MPNTINKVRIQQALIGQAKTGPFYRVTYDPVTDLAIDIDEGVDPPIAVSSVKANEINAQMGEAARYRQSHQLQRTGWTWLLRVGFSCEVTGYRFEEQLMLAPPCLPEDIQNTLRQVTLNLTKAEYTHPITNQPHSGTKIDYYFDVRPLRR